MKDKRNRHGAVGKSSSEQHFRKSAAITFIDTIQNHAHIFKTIETAGPPF